MTEINVKKSKKKAPVRELTAAERISEIDEHVDTLLDERRSLLSKLDQEIASMQEMRNRVRGRSGVTTSNNS